MEIPEIASEPSLAKITTMTIPVPYPMARNRPPRAGVTVAVSKNSGVRSAKSTPRLAMAARRFGSSQRMRAYSVHEKSALRNGARTLTLPPKILPRG